MCRYISSTGEFTVSTGGAGLYYFYVHVLVDDGEAARVELMRNDEILCGMEGDDDDTGSGDYDTTTCAATVMLNTGNCKIVAIDMKQ